MTEVAASGRVRYVDWPPDRKTIDIGSFYADSSKLLVTVGWKPRVSLREGLTRTVEFYRRHLAQYIDQAETPAMEPA